MNCLPLFDYGREQGVWEHDGAGYDKAMVTGGGLTLTLAGDVRLGLVGPRCYGRTTLREGESAFVTLSWGGETPATLDDALGHLHRTERFWRDWMSMAVFPDHRFRPYIERSALVLKGLSYAPTGAIMAAATTSLPETPGGERNWDYRYTWIRDTAFMLRALHGLGFNWEAFEFFAFILDAVGTEAPEEPWALQIMYGIGGERDLTEHTLDHLCGYGGSRPVRTGNGAYDQHQHDVWGMLLDAVEEHLRGGGQIAPVIWERVAELVDTAIERSSGAGPGHLGDARRTPALRGIQGPVLGRRRPGRTTGRHARRRLRDPVAGGPPPTGSRPRSANVASTNGACSPSTTTPPSSTPRCC